MTFRLLHGNCRELVPTIVAGSIDSIVTDPPAGIRFMGKGWDSNKGGKTAWINWFRGIMIQCLIVLKPGAHALVWAFPRTSHWTATALEDAGFEIRDVIIHHFGSGFPKSHNVGLTIDKLKGHEDRGHRIATASKVHPDGTPEPPGEFLEPYKPKTPEGDQWNGWGNNLKPSSEHYILVRKPLSESSIARNVLEHGTGAINIDKSRVNGERYPANLLLTHSAGCTDVCADDCPAGEMDRQSGYSASSDQIRVNGIDKYGFSSPHTNEGHSDSGGASRYFTQFRFESKASQSERHETGQNSHPTIKPINLMAWLCRLITPPGGTILDPFAGSGSTGVAAIKSGFNFIGIEQEREYYDTALTRLEHETEGVLF